MSDYFDNEENTFDSFHGDPYSRSNHDYYHSWQSIDSIEKETDKAYLVKIEFVTFWIAKSLVRDQRLNMIFVHTDIFNDCLEKALKERKQMERLNLVAPVLDPFAKYRK